MWSGIKVNNRRYGQVEYYGDGLHEDQGLRIISGVLEFCGEVEEAYVSTCEALAIGHNVPVWRLNYTVGQNNVHNGCKTRDDGHVGIDSEDMVHIRLCDTDGNHGDRDSDENRYTCCKE